MGAQLLIWKILNLPWQTEIGFIIMQKQKLIHNHAIVDITITFIGSKRNEA
jgi:hypothetical protein